MSKTIEDRSEILFLYEVRDANPNGDPLDENKPRIDRDTGVVTVTDVRIKRTIRDYWMNRKGFDILIKEVTKSDGSLQQGFERAYDVAREGSLDPKKIGAEQFEVYKRLVLQKFIDARVFGCTLPTKGEKEKSRTLALTGPTQFSGFNRSLHPVDVVYVQGTAAFAGGKGAYQRSFRDDYIVPYALIGVYGVVNEIAAKTTNMTEEDRSLLLEGLWWGTHDLISRSKMGHRPLLLIHIRYRNGFRLGDLPSRISLRKEPHIQEDKAIRSVKDYRLDVKGLFGDLSAVREKISDVEFLADKEIRFVEDKGPADFGELPLQRLNFPGGEDVG